MDNIQLICALFVCTGWGYIDPDSVTLSREISTLPWDRKHHWFGGVVCVWEREGWTEKLNGFTILVSRAFAKQSRYLNAYLLVESTVPKNTNITIKITKPSTKKTYPAWCWTPHFHCCLGHFRWLPAFFQSSRPAFPYCYTLENY